MRLAARPRVHEVLLAHRPVEQEGLVKDALLVELVEDEARVGQRQLLGPCQQELVHAREVVEALARIRHDSERASVLWRGKERRKGRDHAVLHHGCGHRRRRAAHGCGHRRRRAAHGCGHRRRHAAHGCRHLERAPLLLVQALLAGLGLGLVLGLVHVRDARSAIRPSRVIVARRQRQRQPRLRGDSRRGLVIRLRENKAIVHHGVNARRGVKKAPRARHLQLDEHSGNAAEQLAHHLGRHLGERLHPHDVAHAQPHRRADHVLLHTAAEVHAGEAAVAHDYLHLEELRTEQHGGLCSRALALQLRHELCQALLAAIQCTKLALAALAAALALAALALAKVPLEALLQRRLHLDDAHRQLGQRRQRRELLQRVDELGRNAPQLGRKAQLEHIFDAPRHQRRRCVPARRIRARQLLLQPAQLVRCLQRRHDALRHGQQRLELDLLPPNEARDLLLELSHAVLVAQHVRSVALALERGDDLAQLGEPRADRSSPRSDERVPRVPRRSVRAEGLVAPPVRLVRLKGLDMRLAQRLHLPLPLHHLLLPQRHRHLVIRARLDGLWQPLQLWRAR